MTRLLPLLAAALTAIPASAQVTIRQAQPDGHRTTGPVIEVDKMIHDYGTIPKGADGTCAFTVTNTGDSPLVISGCESTCGCTVPACPTDPIKPGASSVITVKYDTQRVGPISRTVTMNTNAKNARTLQVLIKGTVEDPSGTPPTRQR